MFLKLPKDAMKLCHSRAKEPKKSFRFNSQHKRASVPTEILNTFTGLGCDMFVSPGEKCLYMTFGKREDTLFGLNNKNGYICCKKLFEWAANAEVPIFDNYEYKDYVIDRKNKIVKLKLERA